MLLSAVRLRALPLAIVVASGLALSACSGMVSHRTQGYVISENALQQIRVGQSEDLVITVLGSPQTKSNFGDESAFYYIETKIEETSFGLRTVQERTVLAIYFDEDRRVKDKAIYGQKDGRLIAIETRRTPSYGQDRTFIESIIASF